MQNKNDMPEISCSALIDSFNLQKGDIVHVASDLFLLMWKSKRAVDPITPDKILDGIQEKIGSTGTLLIPTFNWGFCNGEGFDYNTTPGKTGSLGNTALKRSGFKRTKHPLYSFAVWGKDKELLYNMNNVTSFGSDSPFAYLHKTNAKGIQIDVGYTDCFTYVHYVEEKFKNVVKYRFQKTFTDYYVDEIGMRNQRDYVMFVRDLALNVVTDLSKIGEIFEINGVSSRNIFFDCDIYVVKMGDAYSLIAKDIVENGSKNLCSYLGQKL